MAQKVIIFEINEIPLRIFRHFQSLKPGSNIDRLIKNSQVIETLALDVDQSFLYPSQTWASLNTGAPYSAHKIHWYNDPKPAEYPLYWKTLADSGFTVGAVNTLHSSPAADYADRNPNFKFVIPDCFAADTYTKPKYFEPFQSLNLQAVRENGRAASFKAPVKEAVQTVLNSPRYGIRMRTMVDGASLLAKIAQKKVNRERVRNLQFPLAADIFLKQVRQHEPDLAIMFTNHVAANMHRYWYGLFPQDYKQKVYDEAWVNKYRAEIMAAVDLLDAYMGEIMKLAEDTGRVLAVVSSMGQHANPKLTPEIRKARPYAFRLEKVNKFVDKLTEAKHTYKVEQAMVPQYMLEFPTAKLACNFATEVREHIPGIQGVQVLCDVNAEIVTLSITPDPKASEMVIRGQGYQYNDLGFTRFDVDDHHSGSHCPEGSLIIYNSKTARAEKEQVNYLEYAPAVLEHFGIPRAPYMAEPSFSF